MKASIQGICAIALGICASLLATAPASADDYSAGTMWGTTAGGVAVPGALQSASTHVQNGTIAGQVNAAKGGYLVSTGDGGSIQAIGSQTIITSTINGHNITAPINATQHSTNSGAVTNTGTLYKK